MANYIQRTILVDSQRHAVMHYYFKGDGSGDLVNETVIDPLVDFQNTSPNQNQPQGMYLGVDQLWWDTSSSSGTLGGFAGVLSFDSPTGPMFVWTLSGTPGDSHLDWRDIGGIKDRTGIDATGKLLLTTFGMTDPNAQGTLIVSVKKYSKPYSQYPMGVIGGPVSEATGNLEVPGNSGSA